MKLTDIQVKSIIVGFLIVIVAAFCYTYAVGKKQNEQYARTYQLFQKSSQMIQKNQFSQALPLLRQVEKDQPDSSRVQIYVGAALANNGQPKLAAQKWKKALELDPYLSENANFMIQLAQILVLSGEKHDAKVVLERCKTLPAPPEMPDYPQKVNTLFKQIHQREGGSNE